MSKDKNKESFLWQRYLFWRDMDDLNRANYWLKRIEEFNNEKQELLEKYYNETYGGNK